MHSRSILVLAVVWLSSLVASNAGLLVPSQPVTPQLDSSQDPEVLDAFNHGDHVLQPWLLRSELDPQKFALPEVFRDCRGCHQFDAAHPVSSPQEHCTSCHFGAGALKTNFESDESLNAFKSRTRSAFRHHTHGMLECRECHLPDDGEPTIPGSLLLHTGPGQCARCHEESQALQAAQTMHWFEAASEREDVATKIGLLGKFKIPTDLVKYAKTLDEVFAAGINDLLVAGGEFSHGDHIELQNNCATCHVGIKEASATGAGEGQIVANGCGDCHKRSEDKSARFVDANTATLAGAKPAIRGSFTLGTFSHADHFRAEKPADTRLVKAYGNIKENECKECHKYRPEREGFDGRDFPFDDSGKSRHRYRDCQLCHAVEGWSTGELASGSLTLHGSSSDDGISGWLGDKQKCTACHVFGEPDMAGNRPHASVRRWADKTFEFSGQTHPYITGLDGRVLVDKGCAECHRAVVPKLPTRLIKKTFRHATHLPAPGATLSTEDCTKCHSTATKSDSAGALAVDFRTYDVAYCAECHLGGTIKEVAAPKTGPEPRSVVAFPHAPHAAKYDCTTCHDRGADNMTTSGSALNCKQCHDHKAGGEEVEAEYLFGEQKTCGKCHKDSATDLVTVPAIRRPDSLNTDVPDGAGQTMFAGFRDKQFHPSGSNCAQCHRANAFKINVDDQDIDRLEPIKIEFKNYVRAENPGTFHPKKQEARNSKDELERRLKGQEAGCMSCHWTDVARLRQNKIFPERKDARSKLGNEFRDFPGLKSKGSWPK